MADNEYHPHGGPSRVALMRRNGELRAELEAAEAEVRALREATQRAADVLAGSESDDPSIGQAIALLDATRAATADQTPHPGDTVMAQPLTPDEIRVRLATDGRSQTRLWWAAFAYDLIATAEAAEAEARALREQLAVLRRHIGDASYNALLARAATADPTPEPGSDDG